MGHIDVAKAVFPQGTYGKIIYFLNSLPFLNGPFPFYMKFEKNRNRQKYHHTLKEHPTFTKIAKFGCEML